jgi:heme oxygenase
MLSEILKTQTSVNHLLLEKKLVSFMKTIRTEADYARFLALFYGYFGALELSINKCLNASIIPDYENRRKTEALKIDLKILNQEDLKLAASELLPVIENHLQSLGALYVIEGSTLGGKIISKMIKQQLKTEVMAFTFFTGYGDQSANMWNSFTHILNSITQPDQIGIIVESANVTFQKFSFWFDFYEQKHRLFIE